MTEKIRENGTKTAFFKGWGLDILSFQWYNQKYRMRLAL